MRQFLQGYLRRLVKAAEDPEVAAFKSVICYRTGLAINDTRKEKVGDTVQDSFVRYFETAKKTGNWRLCEKSVNDIVANLALQISEQYSKPIQFHTGLGDK